MCLPFDRRGEGGGGSKPRSQSQRDHTSRGLVDLVNRCISLRTSEPPPRRADEGGRGSPSPHPSPLPFTPHPSPLTHPTRIAPPIFHISSAEQTIVSSQLGRAAESFWRPRPGRIKCVFGRAWRTKNGNRSLVAQLVANDWLKKSLTTTP